VRVPGVIGRRSMNEGGSGTTAEYLMRLTTPGFSSRHAFATDRVSSLLSAVALAVALLLVCALDRETGSSPVQHLYYLPIIFAAVRFGVAGAMIVSATATLFYHAANPHLLSFRYEEIDLVQVALFAAVGLVSAKLTNDARRLHRLAMTDDLTGLHNLRSFEMRLKALVREARMTGAPLSVLVLDLDRLKSLNDVHGHLTGAEAVRMVGRVLATHLRAHDVACRYGGDEFVAALPDCSALQAAGVARDLCEAVNATAPALAGRQFPVGTLSISAGVACDREVLALAGAESTDEEYGEALFRAADAALYAAKAGGRNRISVDGGPISGARLASA
jgi:diguanylate cyclase (GGDEF)-like protein